MLLLAVLVLVHGHGALLAPAQRVVALLSGALELLAPAEQGRVADLPPVGGLQRGLQLDVCHLQPLQLLLVVRWFPSVLVQDAGDDLLGYLLGNCIPHHLRHELGVWWTQL